MWVGYLVSLLSWSADQEKLYLRNYTQGPSSTPGIDLENEIWALSLCCNRVRLWGTLGRGQYYCSWRWDTNPRHLRVDCGKHPLWWFLKTLITSGAIVSHCGIDVSFLLKKRLVECNRNLDVPLQQINCISGPNSLPLFLFFFKKISCLLHF